MATNEFQTFVNKWAKVGAEAESANVPSSGLAPIIAADKAAMLRGTRPMTEADALLSVLQSAPQSPIVQAGGQIFHQKPADPGFNPINLLGAGVKDLQKIATGLNPIHLVPSLLHEVEHAPQIPGDLSKALGEHSAGAALRDLAQTPLLRMVPGVQTAAAATTAQGRLSLREHPLITLVDILPYADMGTEALFSKDAFELMGGVIPKGVRESWNELLNRAQIGKVPKDLSQEAAIRGRKLAQDFSFESHLQEVNKLWAPLTPEDRLMVTKAVQGGKPEELAALPEHLQKVGRSAIYLNRYVQSAAIATGQHVWVEMGDGTVEAYAIRGQGPQTEIARFQRRVSDQQAKIDQAISEGKDPASLTRKLEEMKAELQSKARTVAPERWRPAIRAETEAQLRGMMQGNKEALEALDQGNVAGGLKAAGLDPGTYDQIFGEVSRTWQDLKRKGLDPIGEWRVDASQVAGMLRPAIDLSKVPGTTYALNTALDYRAQISDVYIQLSHAVFEDLRQAHSQVALEWLKQQPFVRTEAQLTEELTKGLRSPDPRVTFDAVKEAAKRRTGWVPIKLGDEELYTPDYVAKTLNALGPHIGGPGTGLNRLWGKGMHIFRGSVLLFSPRYYIHQIMGSAVMLLGETGPSVVKYAADAWQMAKDGTLPADVARGITEVAPEMKTFNTLAGRQMGNAYVDSVKARLGVEGHPIAKLEEVAQHFHNTVGDFTRALAYLYGKEKGGVEEGINLANHVLANWDRMTPVERTVIRNVFPFYGWISHIMRYVLSYPIDHPLRASIVSKFAINEEKDWKTGLPQSFQQLLFLGAPDANGNVESVNVRSLNPFRDVANYLTLGGFLTSLNPLATSILEAVGVRLPQGTPDLYPQLVVDPLTGQLTAKRQNVLPLLLSNFIPQSDVLLSYFGWSNQLRDLKLSNPQALQAHLANAIGFPWLPREYSIPQEESKYLIARQRAASSDLSHALKTGDWSTVQRWSLVPYQGKLVNPLALERLVALLQLGAKEHGIQPPDPKTLLDEFPRGVVPQLLASGLAASTP